jgi:membrane protein required for colicin V production
VDILLLILLAVGFITGLFSGAVKQLISLVAFVVGYVIACLYYQPLGDVLNRFLSMEAVCKVAAFVLLWVAVPIVANLIASLITSALNCLPGLGILNRLLGGILGIAKYALVLGAFIWLFSSANLIKEETMQKSKLCRPLKAVPEYIYNILKNQHQKGSQETRTCLYDKFNVSLDS